MKRRFAVLFVVTAMLFSLVVGCSQSSGKNSGNDKSTVRVSVSLADSTDYYIGTIVGARVSEAFKNAGATVDVLDGASSVSTQLQQIQNAVTNGADIIYVFPVGDAQAYGDTLRNARKAGVKVLVSHNNTGKGTYDAFVGSEEFYMGAMMAKMVSRWIDYSLPDAQKVKALILEAHFNETMAHRVLGMRLISEKFLRKADIRNMYFVKKDGDPVYYKDAAGNVLPVDEPTGGLILDEEGYAILNPFYDPRVELIESSNRVSAGVNATEAQAALEAAVTNGHDDIQIIMSYGDLGITMSQKVIEMSQTGLLKHDLPELAVFGSDATDANLEAIAKSADNTTVFRGVMAAGDLVNTLSEYAAKMVRGEEVPEITMEPLSYVMADENGNLVTVMYTDVEQLSPSIEEFFNY
ncbi:sugar ABC transporter substrate-binding protein [Cohnella laeviribosi]|uniref:sugar ABC transporter substrate-binding protein n=1 Tax=Cohnella laeviribosi TaxID=380174 RepID=UPI00037E7A33|nr:substrate-binding domain-containing protein [Cohnella laeviribosi]